MIWPPFLAAVRFLTRFPAPDPGALDARAQAWLPLYFPVVGLALGLALWVLATLLGYAPAAVTASVLLLAWVSGTGGLHLDGLADSADAWVGGLGSRERTLDIMKDPMIGAMGAIALVLILIAKWAAVTALLDRDTEVLLWLPALARAQLLLVFLTTPYAGRGGIGGRFAADLPRGGARVVVAVSWGACLAMLGPHTWGLALAAGLLFLLWRHAIMKRLGGFTGDTAGGLVELTEVAGLMAVSLMPQ